MGNLLKNDEDKATLGNNDGKRILPLICERNRSPQDNGGQHRERLEGAVTKGVHVTVVALLARRQQHCGL